MKTLSRLAAASVVVLTLGSASIAHAESTGQYIDDATVTTKVKSALISDNQLKASQISVVTNQGTVSLTGIVPTKAQAAEALRVTTEVDGVKTVKDQMKVASDE